MSNPANFKKVIVNHSGTCDGFHYVAGVPVSLREDVLQALGKDSYEVVKEEKESKPEAKDEKKSEVKGDKKEEKKPEAKDEPVPGNASETK